jgi:hypothetical protein
MKKLFLLSAISFNKRNQQKLEAGFTGASHGPAAQPEPGAPSEAKEPME